MNFNNVSLPQKFCDLELTQPLMPINTIQKFYNILEKDHLTFLFQGSYNDDMTEGILELTEYNLENFEGLTKLKKKISFLIVECFQNIVRHGEIGADYEIPEGLFITRNIGDINYIASINYLDNSYVKPLKTTLDKLKTLTKDELKSFYLDTLVNSHITEKGGAGLGLIELARKSTFPLSYEFEKIDENLSAFYFLVRLKNNMYAEEHEQHEPLDLKSFREFYSLVDETNTNMVYKGDFAKASILPILKIFEDSIQNLDGNINIKKRVYIIMMEMLENIAEHAKNNIHGNIELKEGIFILGKKENDYLISTGNIVETDRVGALKEYIELLNSMDYSELRRLYVKNLKRSKIVDSSYEGLGLIDIVSESTDKIDFNFEPINENDTFFSINVQI